MASRDLAFPEKEYTFISESGRTDKLLSQDEFVLEQVLGLTNTSANALDCNQVTGYVAFPAAFTLVLLDPKTNDQKFIESPSVKYISSACFSDDGRLVALGETGCKPYVSVWSLKDHKEISRFIVDSVGVRAVVFHPKSSFLVVLGTQDCNIGVWDYIRGQRLAFTKWQTAPLGLTIPKIGSCIIVCGHRKITLFNTDNIDSNTYETNVFEDRKAVLLGRQSEYTFVDITSGRGKHEKEVYTVTACGFLCEIKLGDILIDKAIKVDVHAFCVRYGLGHVFVGCCEGVVKICHPETLDITAEVSLDQLLGPDAMPKVGAKLYVDTTAIAINEKDVIVTCIYADCSMHSWQINAFKETVECSALLPAFCMKPGSPGYDPNFTDNICQASLFRSFIGCCDKVSGSMMFDPTTLAERHRQTSRQGFMNLFKENRARYQYANAVRFSPDGRDVVCGNEDGEIKVYDAASGALRRVIEAHSSQVTCIDLMYDDEYQLVCSGGRDRIIFVLNAKTDFSLVQVLCDHSAAITTLRLTHNGGLLTLISAAADNVILVRRAIPGKTLKFTVIGEIAESRCNKSVNVTNEYIVTGARNGNIKLFKADPVFSGKPTKTIKCAQKSYQGTQAFRVIDIDPSGSFMATTQTPGQITVYHLQTGQRVASLSSQSDVTAIKFTSDLRYMVSSTSNGCTLVWRLPERMTEFMRFKQEKIYQVEMSREISYETYVSCVRVCKETTVCEDNSDATNCQSECCSNSQHSHVGDSEVTPTIQSLSLLRMCPTCHGEMDKCSFCSTESYLSCSTCSASYTETLAGEPSSDSSYQMHSAPVRLYCGSDHKIYGKSVEGAICTKLGPFKFQTSDHQIYQHSENTNFKEGSNSPAREGSPVMKSPTYCTNQEPGCGYRLSKEVSLMPGTRHKDADQEKGQTLPSHLHAIGQYSENKTDLQCSMISTGDNRKDKTRNKPRDEATSASPTGTDKGLLLGGILCEAAGTIKAVNTSKNYKEVGKLPPIREGLLVRDALTPFYQHTRHTQESTELSHDQDQSKKVNGKTRDPPVDAAVDGSHSDLKPIESPRAEARLYTCASSPMSFRTACSPRTPNSGDPSGTPEDFVFHSPALSPESDTFGSKNHSPLTQHTVIEGYETGQHLSGDKCLDNKERPVNSSCTSKFSETFISSDGGTCTLLPGMVGHEGSRNEILLQELQRVCQAELPYRVSRPRTNKGETAPKTPPNSLESSLTMDIPETMKYVSASPNEGSREMRHKSRNRLSENGRQFRESIVERSPEAKIEAESTDGGGDKISIDLDSPEEGEVYNYHSITRDETGKLRRVSKLSTRSQNHPRTPSPGRHSVTSALRSISLCPQEECNPDQTHEILPRNIQCSRCSHRLGSKSRSSVELNCRQNSTKQEDLALNHQTEAENVSSYENIGTGSVRVPDQVNVQNSGVGQPVLSESQDACCAVLRQCLQLSNSQETFSKLTWENEDRELVDTLSVILRTKPDQFATILNLSASQMDILRKKIYQVDNPDQRAATREESSSTDRSSTTLCSVKAAVPGLLDEKKKMSTAQLNNSSASHGSYASDCNQNTAKQIINIVERMLTEQKPSDRVPVNNEVGNTLGGMRPLRARTHNTHAKSSGIQDDSLDFYPAESEQMSNRKYHTLLEAKSLDMWNPCMKDELQAKKILTRQYVESQAENLDQGNVYMNIQNNDEQKAVDKKTEFLPQKEHNGTSSSSRFQISSVLHKSRFGKLCSCKGGSTRLVTGSDLKHPHTRSSSEGRDEQGSRSQGGQGNALVPSVSSESIRNETLLPAVQEDDGGAQEGWLRRETTSPTETTPQPDNAGTREGSSIDWSPHDSSGPSRRKYTSPTVELFRDQDDYLKKLKEVRQKFERSIQALSNERRSRLAEEDIKYCNK